MNLFLEIKKYIENKMKASSQKSSPTKKKPTKATVASVKKQTVVISASPVKPTTKIEQKPLVMKVLTTTPSPMIQVVKYSTTPPQLSKMKQQYTTIPPPPVMEMKEQQYTTMPPPPPAIIAKNTEMPTWMTTSMTPLITKTLSPTKEIETTIIPMNVITETLAPINIPELTTTTPMLDNLNFISPVVETDKATYVLTNVVYTPIPGWDIKIDYAFNSLSTASPTTPTTQMGNVIIGNGISGGFNFANINTISSTWTQYAIIQYNNTSFNGTYTTTMSYNVQFPSSGKFKLIYYIQARPRMLASNKTTWKIKYNASQTISASIYDTTTEEYSFGSTYTAWGSWVKQEFPFTVPEPGTYPLTFKSTLKNFTGSADTSIAFGAISFETVS